MFIDFNVHNNPINKKAKSQTIKENMMEGISYLKKHDLIKGLLKYVLFLNFIAMSLTVSLPFTSVEVLKASPTQYGLVQMGFPLGMLLMSIIYSMVQKEQDKIFKKTAQNTILFGIVFTLFGLPSSPLMNSFSATVNLLSIGIIAFLMGVVMITINIPLQVMMQKSIDDEYRGRVGGVLHMASQLITPLGLMIFGFMIDRVDSYLLPIISGIMILCIALWMHTDKKMMAL